MQPELVLRVQKGKEAAVQSGVPWVMASDIIASSEHVLAEAGAVAELRTHKDAFIGIGTFNPHSRIVFRLLSRTAELINAQWFEKKLKTALDKREAYITVPYYRLAHAEADGLPGLIIDRFGDSCVLQISTAGMDRLQPVIIEALERVIAPRAIVLRNDTPARTLEGLAQIVSVYKGTVPPLTEVVEHGCVYYADLLHGQKTGWFYDQRANRALVAGYAHDKAVLDVYSHSGGFGVRAAITGAQSVTFVDSSKPALELVMKAAARNGVDARCSVMAGQAFEVMQRLPLASYDIVVADPPAFVKSRADIAAGMKGYAKVARLACGLVKPGGMFFIASCSHHATPPKFEAVVMQGIREAGRSGEIVARTGADRDHPIHPHLPQSGYLKGSLIMMR